MNKALLQQRIDEYTSSSEHNRIPTEKALLPSLASAAIFNTPIFSVARADDIAFEQLKEDAAVGWHFMLPLTWLPSAHSVLSFFFPYTPAIRESNKKDLSYPSEGWLNGRIEGQVFINKFTEAIVALLREQGYKAVAPLLDPRFFTNTDQDKHSINKLYTSNWSERHVAYICGLGTFGLSRGIITEKGTAGRLTSVITSLELPIDVRQYDQLYEYCTMCGKCVKNCPAQAISFEHGKNHEKCSGFLDSVLAESHPWYGCGKCQVAVPCECGKP